MADHDPLPRQHDDEPRFVLLARDPLSDGMVALYAALRGRKMHKVGDIIKNLIVTVSKVPYRPDADPAHEISAQQVANAMLNWRYTNMPKVPTNARGVELDLDQTGEPDGTRE